MLPSALKPMTLHPKHGLGFRASRASSKTPNLSTPNPTRLDRRLKEPLLGGSWVDISGVISRVTVVLSPIRGLIALLRTTHEPPSTKRFCRSLLPQAKAEAKLKQTSEAQDFGGR